MASKTQIHFMVEARKEPDASFAASLIRELGQADINDATHIVSIGGDGLLLRALRAGVGKKVVGIVPPGSSSVGFWTNRGVNNAEDLIALFKKAKSYPIKPLRADIEFADGTSTVRYGYNDVAVRPVQKELTAELQAAFGLSDIDVSVQSALLDLKLSFAKAVIGPARVMGSGLAFATALGSTAMNRNNGGPSIDIRNEGIVLTGIGTSSPAKGFNPVVNNGNAVFDVEVLSQDKRPVMIVYDSFGVIKNENNSPIQRLKISTAHDRAVKLVLADDPGLRAYSAMMP